jgi:hypothetical protein
MLSCLAGNSLWTLANSAAWLRHQRACWDPRKVQEAILARFLHRNAQSAYGRHYGYAKLRTVHEFQDAVPIVTYDDLAPWIERIRRGEPRVLTAEPVLFFEKTSGSAAAAKYIPYTRQLLREFRQAVGAWMFDLFTKRPALLAGTQYWSISPLAREREVTSGGLRVGIDDDTEYLGFFGRRALGWALAVPGSVALAADMGACRRMTLEHLVRSRRLRFISVWSPSFLTLLMEQLPRGRHPLEVWPQLRLISCWTSGASARFVPELRALFPGVEIQGKGLLATEGVVSFPEVERPAPSPAITSHFLEFLGDDGGVRLVDELEVGRRYRVLITTGGGFARYALGDLVEVVAPRAIELVGRADTVSDLCGEKLSEAFVGRILERICSDVGYCGFAMVAPDWSRPPRYLLLAESAAVANLAAEVERQLRTAVHYDYCRRLGQLGPLEGVCVDHAADRYLEGCLALGQRAGSVKPAYLRRELGWRERMCGETAANAVVNRPGAAE